jgi:mxaK protein
MPARLYAARIAFILLFIAASAAVVAASGLSWFAAKRDNAIIAGLLDGKNIEIDPATASSRVLFARAYFLLRRDRIDEAQAVLDQARLRADAKTRVAMLYDMANTRLRVVFDAIDQGQFDKATALIGLAKDQYTEALRLDPEAWDVKYNLDVASRLLRDLPEATPPEEPSREAPKDLWTDLPGVPEGEP